MSAFTKKDLKRFQSESLDDKIQRSFAKISEWYVRWGNEVYVSFSGGKDSTVLADLCARWCKAIGATLYLVFVDTGLEYPEIRQHVKFFAEWLRNKYGIDVQLEIIRPEKRFDEVVKEHGYPIISKQVANLIDGARKNIENGNYSLRLRLLGVKSEEYGGLYDSGEYDYEKSADGSKYERVKYRPLLDVDFRVSDMCCDVMKKSPAHEYTERTGRKPILATMAVESMFRESEWLKNGCNAFDGKYPNSKPMSFWTEQDVLQYVMWNKIPLASVYGDIIFEQDPDQMRIEEFGLTEGGADRLCTTGCDRTGCIFCGFGCHNDKGLSRFERLKETHPRQYQYCIGGGEYNECGVWQPNKKGLGLGHVFDVLNKIYGDDFIKYK